MDMVIDTGADSQAIEFSETNDNLLKAQSLPDPADLSFHENVYDL